MKIRIFEENYQCTKILYQEIGFHYQNLEFLSTIKKPGITPGFMNDWFCM